MQKICDVWSGSSAFGTWGDNNEILFSIGPSDRNAIFRVPANGGTPTLVKNLGNESAYHPQWLPGSRLFLFCRSEDNLSGRIFAASMDGSLPPKQVMEFETGNTSGTPEFLFSPPGYLFFNQSGSLCVQKFDLKSLSVIGSRVPISGLVGTPRTWFTITSAWDKVVMLSRESMNDSGNPGDPLARLKWFDRRGEVVGILGPPRRYWTLRLSPDGLRAAVNPDSDIWILESGNRLMHLTSGPGDEWSPVWSPDATKIVFSYSPSQIFIQSASQEGEATELLSINADTGIPMDWSRDGRYILLNVFPKKESPGGDLWLYDFKEKSARPWLSTKSHEGQARFSPDGRWIAYVSDANGPDEVYIRQFKGEGNPIPISSGGGKHAAWRKDGRELFYLSHKDELMAVSIANLDTMPVIGESRLLFKMIVNDITSELLSPYDVTPDGQRFLVNTCEQPESLLFIQGLEELWKKGQ